MIRRLYNCLTRLGGYEARSSDLPILRDFEDRPTNAEEIKIVYPPRGLIEAGQAVLRGRYQEQMKLEGQLE